MVRPNLVTHGRAPVGRPPFALRTAETAGPAEELVWGRLYEADSRFEEWIETDQVVLLLASFVCASEPPVKVD